jgi:hypothetical protein
MAGARRRFFAGVLASLLPGAAAIGAGAAVVSAPSVPAVTDSAMLDETDGLARALTDARHLAPMTIGFRRRLVDAAEARAAAEAVVGSAFAPDELAGEEKMLRRLGLLPAGADYLKLMAGALGRQPAGFYDPEARRLYVADWIELGAQRAALAHELAHALQDQRVGLRRFLGLAPAGRPGLALDARLARQALVEGDAGVLAMEALDPRGAFPAPLELAELDRKMRAGVAALDRPADQDPGAREAAGETARTAFTPLLLREILSFPYVDGFAFVARVRGLEPWSVVDALWNRPPESTAQILHPEKYDRHEAPLEIDALPLPALAAGYQAARADTLGELVVRVWLAAVASPEVAERAAAGWRGDRMTVYLPVSSPGQAQRGAALAWLTAWDSEADADDFLQVAGARLAELADERVAGEPGLAQALAPHDQPTVFREAGTRLAFAIQRRRATVALLLGVPTAAAAPSLAAMLNDWPARLRAVEITRPPAAPRPPAAARPPGAPRPPAAPRPRRDGVRPERR